MKQLISQVMGGLQDFLGDVLVLLLQENFTAKLEWWYICGYLLFFGINLETFSHQPPKMQSVGPWMMTIHVDENIILLANFADRPMLVGEGSKAK